MQVSPSSGQLMAMQNYKTNGKRNAIIKAQHERRLLLEKVLTRFHARSGQECALLAQYCLMHSGAKSC